MWYVSQIGRREHYALPAHLHRIGQLGLFATDIWAPWAASPKSLIRSEKLAQRFESTMGDAPVVSRPLYANLAERFRRGNTYQRWTREGASFGKFAAREFERAGLKEGDTILGYTAANLEQIELAKKRGAKALHVQVDPGMSWYETRRMEQLNHPEAEDLAPMPDAEFVDRIGQEWQAADKVIVHSAHSREALLSQGVAPERCVVIPPAFRSSTMSAPRRIDANRPLRVLFVGNHCLAKGYHIFASAARLAGKGFEFISIGGQSMRPSYLAKTSQFISMQGHLTYAKVREQMMRADVLVFPTLSDGFGLVQLEAMAAGLPVIATGCCGEVVRHGHDGLIVPPRDSGAVVAALGELRADPDKYEQLSMAASIRPNDFSSEKHVNALLPL
jgi:glycosyltransferase involved in cell wall biosynthesis